MIKYFNVLTLIVLKGFFKIMTGLLLVVGVLIIIISVVITALIMMQESPSDSGMSALTGGGSDSFFSKNQGRTHVAMLAKVTRYAAIAFIVLSIALQFIITLTVR